MIIQIIYNPQLGFMKASRRMRYLSASLLLLEIIAYFMPLTYAVDALNEVSKHISVTTTAWRDLAVVFAFIAAALLFGALTLRRRVK